MRAFRQPCFPIPSFSVLGVHRKEHRCSRNIFFPKMCLSVWCPLHRFKYRPLCKPLGQGLPVAVLCRSRWNIEDEREARWREGWGRRFSRTMDSHLYHKSPRCFLLMLQLFVSIVPRGVLVERLVLCGFHCLAAVVVYYGYAAVVIAPRAL